MRKNAVTSELIYDFTVNPDPIGAGGFTIVWGQAPDNSWMLAGTDVVSPDIRRAGDKRWGKALNPKSVPRAHWQAQNRAASIAEASGCTGVVISPADPNIALVEWRGYIFKTSDKGNNWLPVLGPLYTHSNAPNRLYGPNSLVAHPTDKNSFMFGSKFYAGDASKCGCFYTKDGGANWSKIAGLPNPVPSVNSEPGKYVPFYDRGSPNIVYVYVEGVGVHRSNNGEAGPYTLVANSPTTMAWMDCTATTGILYCVNDVKNSNDLFKLTRGANAFTTSATGINSASSVAVDPFDDNHIVCCAGAWWAYTIDGGAYWSFCVDYTNARITRGTGEVAWLSNLGVSGVVGPHIYFDRVVRNKVWVIHGTGIGWLMLPTVTEGSIDIHDFSAGKEEKVTASFLSIPGKNYVLTGNWDYAVCAIEDKHTYTNRPVNAFDIAIGMQMDYAADDTNTVFIAIGQSYGTIAGVSYDGGKTWQRLPGQANFWMGGSIAVNRKNQMIVMETDDRNTRRWDGTTWRNVQLIPGTDLVNARGNAYYVKRWLVSADKTVSGKFAILVQRNHPQEGIWVTTDSGASWTQTRVGIPRIAGEPLFADPDQVFNAVLEYVPGFTGDLVYTGHSDVNRQDWLMYMANDGASAPQRLGAAGDVTNVSHFSFGATMPGQTRPSVNFLGFVGGVYGHYVSYDWFATAPLLIAEQPMDNLSDNQVCGANVNELGEFHVGGIGWNRFFQTPTLRIGAQ